MTHLIMVIFINAHFDRVAEGDQTYRSVAACQRALTNRDFPNKAPGSVFRELHEIRPNGDEVVVRAICQEDGKVPQ